MYNIRKYIQIKIYILWVNTQPYHTLVKYKYSALSHTCQIQIQYIITTDPPLIIKCCTLSYIMIPQLEFNWILQINEFCKLSPLSRYPCRLHSWYHNVARRKYTMTGTFENSVSISDNISTSLVEHPPTHNFPFHLHIRFCYSDSSYTVTITVTVSVMTLTAPTLVTLVTCATSA